MPVKPRLPSSLGCGPDRSGQPVEPSPSRQGLRTPGATCGCPRRFPPGSHTCAGTGRDSIRVEPDPSGARQLPQALAQYDTMIQLAPDSPAVRPTTRPACTVSDGSTTPESNSKQHVASAGRSISGSTHCSIPPAVQSTGPSEADLRRPILFPYHPSASRGRNKSTSPLRRTSSKPALPR